MHLYSLALCACTLLLFWLQRIAACESRSDSLWPPLCNPRSFLLGRAAHRFESNFPVDKMGGASYHVLWNMFKKLCEARGTSEDDKAKLFFGTAAKVYNIGDKGAKL